MSLSQHFLQHTDADRLYVQLLRDLVTEGERSAPRGRPIREKRPMVLRIEDSRRGFIQHPARGLSKGLMYVEPFQMIMGTSVPDMLKVVAPNYAQFVNPDTQTMDGAYPPRVFKQLPYVLKLIKNDPDTRQAVIAIYGTQDQRVSRDVPCTETMQFFIRNSKLELFVNMRSSDAWLGIPYDIAQFTILQLAVAAELGVEPGAFVLSAGSSHIYERDEARIHRFLDESVWGFETPAINYPQVPYLESQLEASHALLSWWEDLSHPLHLLQGVYKEGFDYLSAHCDPKMAATPAPVRAL